MGACRECRRLFYIIGLGCQKTHGVCGGIAEYFDMDPVIVRIIFLLTTMFTGVGQVAYIICALAFPKKSKVVA